MIKNKKIMVIVTSLMLAVLIFIVFGELFIFEKGKDNSSVTIDEQLVQKLYNYLPYSNDNDLDSVYSNYSSFNSLNIGVIEGMIVNYLKNYANEKLDSFSVNELYNIGVDATGVKPLYKISDADLKYGLITIFGIDRDITFKDALLDFKTRARYYDNYLYIYEDTNSVVNNSLIYKIYDGYSYSDKNTIKIYDYYLVCDRNTTICYNDDKKTSINSNVKFSNTLNVNAIKGNLKKYEHTFRYNNENYYWESSKIV